MGLGTESPTKNAMTNLLALRKPSWIFQVTPDPELSGAQDHGSVHTRVFVSPVLHQSRRLLLCPFSPTQILDITQKALLPFSQSVCEPSHSVGTGGEPYARDQGCLWVRRRKGFYKDTQKK